MVPRTAVAPLPVGDGIHAEAARWTFGGDVFQTFDEHVSKSVPLYREGHELVAQLSDFFVRPDGLVLDVGCSTGTLIRTLAERHQGSGARFLGVDVEPGMAAAAAEQCAAYPEISILEADAAAMELDRLDFATLYYTLQFMPRERRRTLLASLYAALPEGGALVVFEKVRSATPMLQDLMQQTYQEFKVNQGYTPDEVLGKSRSLKGVLDCLTSEENIAMLRGAGFGQVMTMQKYICFEGFLAVK
ncbi:methyltransferase domain-containing protein [Kitasatospora sp. NPDC057512]|uniref:methyltransferase domain-containing protein n=1 Tax=Kitasatospora sp. NPDC057512 TaxID=3346154 RepID=UPI0036BAAB35